MRLFSLIIPGLEPRLFSPYTHHACTGHGVDGVHMVVYPGWYSRRYTRVGIVPSTMLPGWV